MAPTEQLDIIQRLLSSGRAFVEALAGVSDNEAATRPGEERWSVLECIEHVVMVEERFLAFLQTAKRLDSPDVNKDREAAFASRVVNREMRVTAPEPVRPTGRFATLAEAVDAFNGVRDRSLQMAQQKQGELYLLANEHPRFGVLNGVEILLFIAGHAERHACQIREVLGR